MCVHALHVCARVLHVCLCVTCVRACVYACVCVCYMCMHMLHVCVRVCYVCVCARARVLQLSDLSQVGSKCTKCQLGALLTALSGQRKNHKCAHRTRLNRDRRARL